MVAARLPFLQPTFVLHILVLHNNDALTPVMLQTQGQVSGPGLAFVSDRSDSQIFTFIVGWIIKMSKFNQCLP